MNASIRADIQNDLTMSDALDGPYAECLCKRHPGIGL